MIGLVALVSWWVVTQMGWLSPRALPSPFDILAVARQDLGSGRLWLDVGATAGRVALGVLIATILGGALGLALGASRRRWERAEPVVDFLRSVPPILTFPLFLLALGYGEVSRIGAVAAGSTGIVVFQVAAGLSRAPRERADAVTLAGLTSMQTTVHLYWFEALPSLFVGIRLAVACGLVISVVTEMLIGASHGLGARAVSAELAYRADELWFVVILSGTVGYGMSGAVAWLERRVVHWK